MRQGGMFPARNPLLDRNPRFSIRNPYNEIAIVVVFATY